MCSEETFGIESPKLENSNESNEQQSKQTKEVEVAAQYSQLQPIEINKYTPKVPLDIRDDLDVRRAIDNLNKWKSKKSGSKKETSFFCPLCALKYSNTHLKIKKHECSKCNFLAFSKNEVDKHEITHLSKMKVCDKCEKQYKHNHTCKK